MLTVGVGSGAQQPGERRAPRRRHRPAGGARASTWRSRQPQPGRRGAGDGLRRPRRVPPQRRPPAVLAVADDPQAGPVAERRHLPADGRLVDDGDADRARRHVQLDPARTPRRRPPRRSSPTPTGSPSSSGSRNPPSPTSQATVQEAVQPGYTAGPTGPDNDFRCELQERGRRRARRWRASSPSSGAPCTASFTLPSTANIGQEIVTCTVWNSFDYDPEIAITKINAPTAVRGDLTPPATVTSNYAVTNPGNTPLQQRPRHRRQVRTGDAGARRRVQRRRHQQQPQLDLAETWQFTCTRAVVGARRRRRPGRRHIVNTATVTGTDPTGTTVDGDRHRRRRRLLPGHHADQARQRRSRWSIVATSGRRSPTPTPSPTPATRRSAR